MTDMKNQFCERLLQLILRHWLLSLLLAYVLLAQSVPALGEHYARHLYPVVSYMLSFFPQWIPFSVSDLFVIGCIGLAVVFLIRLCFCPKRMLRLRRGIFFLTVLYTWFYIAWGLNYSQATFFERTKTSPVEFNENDLQDFAIRYIRELNEAFLPDPAPLEAWELKQIGTDIQHLYQGCAMGMGIHAPHRTDLQAKTMLYTPLASMVGVTGSMAPFFCEFTLNGDLLPLQYPATYAHELSHYLGIAREAEANFYAYQICTRSTLPLVRYSGYMSLLPHVLSNARHLLDEKAYADLVDCIRPEVKAQYERQRQYWQAKYSETLGKWQDRMYDLYLKGNKIASGRKNYSEVIGLLLSWEQVHVSTSQSLH